MVTLSRIGCVAEEMIGCQGGHVNRGLRKIAKIVHKSNQGNEIRLSENEDTRVL